MSNDIPSHRRNIHKLGMPEVDPDSWDAKRWVGVEFKGSFTMGSMTQGSFGPKEGSGHTHKAWMTHFAGDKGWSVGGCEVGETTARDKIHRIDGKALTKTEAIEACCDYVRSGSFRY